MRLLISGFLIVLGFIFGVIYDQAIVVLPLQQEITYCLAEKNVLNDAFDAMMKNKFKKKDYILDQVRKFNREHQL